MERQTDDEVVEEVMANLRAMFPDIKNPDDVIVTRWGREKHVLGAYSFPSPGQDFYQDIETLAQTIGKLHFAGEATTNDGWATVSLLMSSFDNLPQLNVILLVEFSFSLSPLSCFF